MLEEYKAEIGTVASIVTILQLFSPVFICKDIVKRKSSKGIDVMPFVGGLVICCLMLQNGVIIEDLASILVNLFGFLLNLGYLALYIRYTDYKGKLWITLLKAFTFVAVLLAYVNKEDPQVVEFRFGVIMTVLLLLLIGSPLIHTKEIMRKKDASCLPMPLIISGTGVTFCWLLYGIALGNTVMVLQNVVALVLSLLQILLYIMYPPKKEKQQKKRKSEKDKKSE